MKKIDLVVFFLMPIILASVSFSAGLCFGLIGIIFAVIIGGGVVQLVSRESDSSPKEGILSLFVSLFAIEAGIYFASRVVELEGLILSNEIMSSGGLVAGFFCFSIGWMTAWSCDRGKNPKKPGKKDPKEFDAIIVFAFGDSYITNCRLIKVLVRYINEGDEVLTQKSLYQELLMSYQDRCYELPQSTEEISTYGLVKEFKKVAKEKNWKNVMIFAAKQHVKRCRRDLKKEGFGVLAVGVTVDYNSDDKLWHVRNWLFWWIRERILRMLPFWLYKRVTT